jgi:cyclohexyl-isocyanide hydratase
MTRPSPDPPPLQLGMLIYPRMTLLDLAGPQAALGMHGRTHRLWKTLDPVLSDTGCSRNYADGQSLR